ncbi:T6SS immunity protein Tdi1 domain-containing protein [Deinococcus seoulensis]|nr:T6SS immunity protein Tdi1 domain-containing protein [Deinococcus seoulensis]
MIEEFFSMYFDKPAGPVLRPAMTINHPVIRHIYEEYGICTSRNGFFRVIDPEKWQESYMPWFRLMRDDDGVYEGPELFPFMTTVFGYPYIFSNLENATVAGYIDVTDNFHTLGHASALFEEVLLDDVSYQYSLYGEVYEDLMPVDPLLTSEECFGFFPPITMGGEPSAETVQRVKLREHLHFLAEISGLPTK